MTPAARRLRGLAVAAALATGAVSAVFPQHAASVALVAITGVALVVALGVVAVASAVAGRDRPRTALDGRSVGTAPVLAPAGLSEARRDLGARRDAGGLPSAIRDRLRAGTTIRLRRHGVDLGPDRSVAARARGLLDPGTWALLAEPERRGGAPGHPDRVAAVVHRALDDLDRLGTGPGGDLP